MLNLNTSIISGQQGNLLTTLRWSELGLLVCTLIKYVKFSNIFCFYYGISTKLDLLLVYKLK